MTVTTRVLGRSGIEVSALGMGCWAIGGPWFAGDQPLGWGQVDDDESVRAVHRALELGVTFFDTADTYGAGHSERVLGRALAGRRDEAVIATKWGSTFDEATKQATGPDSSPAYLRRAVEASLRRLGTDRIDLYQLHLNDLAIDLAEPLLGVLADLVAEGKIRWYGWSTDFADRAESWALGGTHTTAIQHSFSVLQDSPEVLAVCEKHDLASINRGPLGMGLLTGKYTASTTLAADDVRGIAPEWLDWFRDGRPAPEWLRPGRRGPGGAHRGRPHAGPGSARLALGAQRPYGADPGVPDGGAGGGERGRAGVRAAHRRAVGRGGTPAGRPAYGAEQG